MDHTLPRSPYAIVGGIVYFGRMVDKIRLHEAGTLRPDLCPNLGVGFDGLICEFLQVAYTDIVEQVKITPSDDEVLEWCFLTGVRPSALLLNLWNLALTRRGWKDDYSAKLQERLAEGGYQDRKDIQTLFDYIDLDEGRDPRLQSA